MLEQLDEKTRSRCQFLFDLSLVRRVKEYFLELLQEESLGCVENLLHRFFVFLGNYLLELRALRRLLGPTQQGSRRTDGLCRPCLLEQTRYVFAACHWCSWVSIHGSLLAAINIVSIISIVIFVILLCFIVVTLTFMHDIANGKKRILTTNLFLLLL